MPLPLCRVGREKDAFGFTAQLLELQTRREVVVRELAELNVQLKIVEESRDGLRENLAEAKRQLTEGQQLPLVSVCVCVCVCVRACVRACMRVFNNGQVLCIFIFMPLIRPSC